MEFTKKWKNTLSSTDTIKQLLEYTVKLVNKSLIKLIDCTHLIPSI